MANIKSTRNSSPKSRSATSILALLFGWLGVHRFYIGKARSALLMLSLFIFGLLIMVLLSIWGINTFANFILLTALAIWYLVDLVFLVSGKLKDAERRPITKW